MSTPKLVSYFSLAGGTNPDARYASNIGAAKGWPGFVKDKYEPAMAWLQASNLPAWGQLHNPFGRSPGQSVMEFSQFIHASDANLAWMVPALFSQMWSKWQSDGGWNTISYIGGIRLDWYLKQKDAINVWLYEVMRSVAPLLESGFHLGFDATTSAAEDSTDYGFFKMIKAKLAESGRLVYAEATPKFTTGHWWRENLLIREPTWRDRHVLQKHASNKVDYPKWDPDRKRLINLTTGEAVKTGLIFRLVRTGDLEAVGLPRTGAAMVQAAQKITEEGHIAVIDTKLVQDAKIPASECVA